MTIDNFSQLAPIVTSLDPKAMTISGKVSRFPVKVLSPLLENFENTAAAQAVLNEAMTNSAQVPLLNELRQVWMLTKLFGTEFSMTGGVSPTGQATRMYHAELGLLSETMATKFKEKYPTIDITGAYLCIGLDGQVIPLIAKQGRGGRMILKSPKGLTWDLYPEDEDVEALGLEVTVSVGKMGKFDVPVFTASWDQYTQYTGRVASFRETKTGVVGMQDRHAAQVVVNAINASVADSGAGLTDFVREITQGGGGDKFGVQFSTGPKGIYPISPEGVFIIPSANNNFENTLVSCVGPKGIQKFRLSPQQGEVLQSAISMQYQVTDATGKVTQPNKMFAATQGTKGLALAYVSDSTYIVQKGKRTGQEAISEEIVLIAHPGHVFIDGTGKVWDQASGVFVEPNTPPVSTEINTFFEQDGDADGEDDTAIIPEAVFKDAIKKTKAVKNPVDVVDDGEDEDEDEEPTVAPTKKVVATAAEDVEFGEDDDDDADYESEM